MLQLSCAGSMVLSNHWASLHLCFLLLALLLATLAESFQVVWNAPSEVCKKRHSIDFGLNPRVIGFNANYSFTPKAPNDKIVLFYEKDLGLYPWLKPIGEHTYAPINGGVPQEVNLTAHLMKVEQDVALRVPNPEFDGLAVIDWEEWRFLYEANWGSKRIYKLFSKRLIANSGGAFPGSNLLQITAEQSFNSAAKKYVLATLQKVKKLRPKAKWGFYLYPECHRNEGSHVCNSKAKWITLNLLWLYREVDALYPSLYFYESSVVLPYRDRFEMIASRVSEAYHARGDRSIPIYGYVKLAYDTYKNNLSFYSTQDLCLSFLVPHLLSLDGVIIWSSYHSFSTAQRCSAFADFLTLHSQGYIHSLQRHVKLAMSDLFWLADENCAISQMCLTPTDPFSCLNSIKYKEQFLQPFVSTLSTQPPITSTMVANELYESATLSFNKTIMDTSISLGNGPSSSIHSGSTTLPVYRTNVTLLTKSISTTRIQETSTTASTLTTKSTITSPKTGIATLNNLSKNDRISVEVINGNKLDSSSISALTGAGSQRPDVPNTSSSVPPSGDHRQSENSDIVHEIGKQLINPPRPETSIVKETGPNLAVSVVVPYPAGSSLSTTSGTHSGEFTLSTVSSLPLLQSATSPGKSKTRNDHFNQTIVPQSSTLESLLSAGVNIEASRSTVKLGNDSIDTPNLTNNLTRTTSQHPEVLELATNSSRDPDHSLINEGAVHVHPMIQNTSILQIDESKVIPENITSKLNLVTISATSTVQSSSFDANTSSTQSTVATLKPGDIFGHSRTTSVSHFSVQFVASTFTAIEISQSRQLDLDKTQLDLNPNLTVINLTQPSNNTVASNLPILNSSISPLGQPAVELFTLHSSHGGAVLESPISPKETVNINEVSSIRRTEADKNKVTKAESSATTEAIEPMFGKASVKTTNIPKLPPVKNYATIETADDLGKHFNESITLVNINIPDTDNTISVEITVNATSNANLSAKYSSCFSNYLQIITMILFIFC